MGAAAVLEQIALAGVTLTALDAEHLAATPGQLLTDELRNLIRTDKPQLLQLLRAENHSAPSDREAFEERAAIREYDGGYSREDAELLAAWEMAQARFARLTSREWLARYAPDRLPAGDDPANYPIAQVKPGIDFWLIREQRRHYLN